VAVDASTEEVRAAFRSLIRERHPDRAGAGATVDTRRLLEARRVLSTEPRTATAGTRSPPPPAPRPAGPPPDARAHGDTLVVRDADPATVMAQLIAAGHELGDVTYLDRSAGLLEVLLMVSDARDDRPAAVSMVLSLQGRADRVEVFGTVERLDGHPPPAIAPLVAVIAAAITGACPA